MNARETSSSQTPFKLHAGRALWQGVKLAWERLGLVLAVSLTHSLATMAVLAVWILFGKIAPAIGNLLGIGITLATMPPLLAGGFSVAQQTIQHEEFAYLDMWRGAGRFYGVAVRLGLIQAGIFLMLGLNIWFYMAWRSPLAIYALVATLYALLLWSMMVVYQYPTLIAQETGLFDEPERRAKRGAIAVLRRSLFLALGSPLYTLLVLVGVLLLTLLTSVLFVALWSGLLTFVLSIALRELLMKYEIIPRPEPIAVIPDEQFRINLPQ